MPDGLTLNKITSQKGVSIGEAARRVADLGWTPSYVRESMSFPTDCKITKAPKDPMKQVSFEEKDMWTLDHVRGYTIQSPLINLREMTPEQRDQHIADYRKGYTVHRI
jgi:hypothetical protein